MTLFLRTTAARLTKTIVPSPQTSSLLLNTDKRFASTDSKDFKTAEGQDFERRRSRDNVEMVGIGKNRYVSVFVFTTPQVEIREFYYAPTGPLGKLLPSRRGINLSIEQYENFKKLIPEIDKKLSNINSLPVVKIPVEAESDAPKSTKNRDYS